MPEDRRLARLAGRSIEEIRGVGPKSGSALRELGIETVLDLVTYYPRRHIDRTNARHIGDLAEGDDAVVLATVSRVDSRKTRSRRTLVQVTVADDTGNLRCTFFNQPWRARQLDEGCEVVVAGKVTTFKGARQMSNPTVDLVGRPGHRRTGRLVPVYRQSEKAGLSTWDIEPWIEEALRRAGEFSDPLPRLWREKIGLVGRTEALRGVHFPENGKHLSDARRRVIFDEMLRLQLVLVQRKCEMEESETGIVHDTASSGLLDLLVASLEFDLTGAQRRAVEEIAADMASSRPMHRLLQGDVGAGKTLVAVAAMLVAGQGGHQAAMMVPTEVLAEQHFAGMRRLLLPLSVDDPSTLTGTRPYRIELLTSATSSTHRTKILRGLAAGEIDAVVGTHSLLSPGVEFSSLGVVVVDEQHRFGVDQRAALRTKRSDGRVPDLLVMSATPIPRSVAMTVFGDLDTTVLDEMPPGRTPVETVWPRGGEVAAWKRVRAEVGAGRQAYVVCPLVEESDAIQARAATEEFYRLEHGPLEGLRIGLVHGQMAAREKEASMDAFRSGKLDVLVSTTVIEVGVDVPNATVMVIEDAWRFGIAQLHQLRGRVGRGEHASWCILLGDPAGTPGEARLEAICATTDGFRLAETDLAMRGEGSVTGASQSGRSSLRLGSVLRDRELVGAAREVAQAMVDGGWRRRDDPDLGAEIDLFVDDDEAGFLLKG